MLLESDDLARKHLLLQKYRERIEKLSQQDKLSKFCMDAGFLNVVEIGQCFHDEKHFKILTIQRYAVGVENKIMSMNKDNYHSCVRISHS